MTVAVTGERSQRVESPQTGANDSAHSIVGWPVWALVLIGLQPNRRYLLFAALALVAWNGFLLWLVWRG